MPTLLGIALAVHLLQQAAPVLLPLTLALLLSMLLWPVMRALVRAGLPQPLSAASIVSLVVSGAVAALYVITPAILGRRLSLDPIAILLSLLVWGWLWGPLGLLMAVPLLVCIRLVWRSVSEAQALISPAAGPAPSPDRSPGPARSGRRPCPGRYSDPLTRTGRTLSASRVDAFSRHADGPS